MESENKNLQYSLYELTEEEVKIVENPIYTNPEA
jgi:hypothetical protein